MTMKNRRFRIALPTVAEITEVLDINPENGTFIFKERPLSAFVDERIWKSWNARFAGTSAGSIDRRGYLVIRVKYSRFFAHRLLWKVATNGDEPDELDHIDRNPLNNRISNLRPATRSENNRNKRLSKYNTTGFTGVYRGENDNWVAQMKIDGVACHLGSFDTIDEAIAARQGAAAMVRLYAGAAMQKKRAQEAQKGRK